MTHTIYFAMEFHGAGDPYFGGTAADWALYKTGDGGQAFISAADAQRRNLVLAYFPTATEAEQAGTAASTRKGGSPPFPGNSGPKCRPGRFLGLSATNTSARTIANSPRTLPTGRSGQARPTPI